MNKDQDGRLTRSELPLAFGLFLSKADKNGDGFVTPREMQATVGNTDK